MSTTRLPFVNADEIASERWPGVQAKHGCDAVRIAEAQRRDRITGRESFVSETVFSHPSKFDLGSDAVDAGYLVRLHVIIVPVELTVQRVVERVRRGGHAVPERKIRDRYDRLWEHVGAATRIADVTEVLDNSSAGAPFRLCATYGHGALVGSPSWPAWAPPALRGSGGERGPSKPQP